MVVLANAILSTLTPSLIFNVLFVNGIDSSSHRAHGIGVHAGRWNDRLLCYNFDFSCWRRLPGSARQDANLIRVRAKSLLVFLDNCLAEYGSRFFDDLLDRNDNVRNGIIVLDDNLSVDFLTALCT
jgi:hypothetical protein